MAETKKVKVKARSERGLEVGRVADVAEAGADGAGDALGRESGLEERDALPVDEDPDDSGEGEGVEEEDVGGAGVGVGLKAATMSPPRAGPTARARLLLAALRRDGLGDELAGDELGDDGLPGGVVHGGADVEQEGEGEERPGRDVAEEGEDGEDGDGGEHPGLPEDEEAAAVEDVGGGAGEQAEEEDGEAGRGLHEGDEQRRGGEGGHQPGAGGVLHPGADGGDGGGDPAVAEERDVQRGEATGGLGHCIGRRIGDLRGHALCVVYAAWPKRRGFVRLGGSSPSPYLKS